MGGIYQGIIGQCRQGLQRLMHLLWTSLEQASASPRKQRVTTKQQRGNARGEKCDMVEGMARYGIHVKTTPHDLTTITITNPLGQTLDVWVVRTDNISGVTLDEFRKHISVSTVV